MKLTKLTKLIKSSALLITGMTLTTTTQAQVLLTIDDSNPGAVVFTATGNFAAVNDYSTTAQDGVGLLDFFTGNNDFADHISGSLTGGNSGAVYSSAFATAINGYTIPKLDLDFHNYDDGSGATQTFNTHSAAFTGSVTIDLNYVAGALRPAGYSGNIQAGYYYGVAGPIIGRWQVINGHYQTIAIDNFKDGSSFTLSDSSGTAKYNYLADAPDIIGGRRQIRVRSTSSGYYGPSAFTADVSAGTLASYGGDTGERSIQYGSGIGFAISTGAGPGMPVNLNLNLTLASSININVTSATNGNTVTVQFLCGDGNTRSASITVNSAGLYNIPLTSFTGITTNDASDIDGIIVSPISSATTAAQGLVLNQLSIISIVAKPALGIGTYVGQPAVYFPTATGTNFVLQMTTNLTTGNWVNVTNGIPINGMVITNPAANAFFRLQ